MDSQIKAVIDKFKLDYHPVEGTLYKNIYKSSMLMENGKPYGTAIIGMYCDEPFSVSCFHKLEYDEVWHAYGGDPFRLFLLYPDGSHETITMGLDYNKGQKFVHVIPAGTWQAGEMIPGGKFSIYGCTMAPGFDGNKFEAALADKLVKEYPACKEAIIRLSVNGDAVKMPSNFND